MLRFRDAASHLVTGGEIHFGTYPAPFRSVNLLDARLDGRSWLPRRYRDLRLKEWQAFQFGNGDLFGNIALFNAKLLGLVQLKLYDRASGTHVLFERKVAPGALRIPDQVRRGDARYEARGCTVVFRTRLDDGCIEIEVDIQASGETPAIRGQLRADTRGVVPQIGAMPFAAARGMCSQKIMAPAVGSLMVGEREHAFEAPGAFVFMDDHKGYYPRPMKWDWATAGGLDATGRLVGFNLTRNQSLEPTRYHENCVWIDGALHRLPPVCFERHPAGATPEHWSVRDGEGRVDVRFDVEVDGHVHLELGVVRSRYRGVLGGASGQLVLEDGETVELHDLRGMAEDFDLSV